jgi:hypothetical protein
MKYRHIVMTMTVPAMTKQDSAVIELEVMKSQIATATMMP